MEALNSLKEPLRIIAQCTPSSVASAVVVMGVARQQDIRCSVRIIPQYTARELMPLVSEEYPSFVLIDCGNELYSSQLQAQGKQVLVLRDAYIILRESTHSSEYAYVVVAGSLAEYLEQGGVLDVPNEALTDSLQAGQLKPESKAPIADVTEAYISPLIVRNNPAFSRLIDCAQMLNACIRTGKASTAIAAFLGDSWALANAAQTLADYRRDLQAARNWYERRKNESAMLSNGVLLVHLKDYAAHHITAALAANLRVQPDLEDNTFILVLAYTPDDKLRFSLRLVGHRSSIHLLSLALKFCEGLNADCSGTASSADGLCPKADEQRLLSSAQRLLERAFVEEMVG